MATSEEFKDLKKERLSEREVAKFQDNVDEILAQYKRIIKDLEERIFALENP